MHMNWLPGLTDDLYYEFLAFRTASSSLGGLGVHGIDLNLGENTYTCESGPETLGQFRSYAWNVGMSYGIRIGESHAVGVSAKLFHQHLAPASVLSDNSTDAASSDFVFDIGYLYKNFLLRELTLGVALTNIGNGITFPGSEQTDPVPTTLRTGLSWRVLQNETVTLNLAYDASSLLTSGENREWAACTGQETTPDWLGETLTNSLNQVLHNAGMELWISRMLALRAGAMYQQSGGLYLANGSPIPTFGAGVRIGIYGFDFSYVAAGSDHPLHSTARFSMSLQF